MAASWTARFSPPGAPGGRPAQARGLDRRLAQETRFPVYVGEDPLTCVVRGAAEILEEAEVLQKAQARLNTRNAPP